MSCIEVWKLKVLVMDYRGPISLPILGVWGRHKKTLMAASSLEALWEPLRGLPAPEDLMPKMFGNMMQPSLIRLS